MTAVREGLSVPTLRLGVLQAECAKCDDGSIAHRARAAASITSVLSGAANCMPLVQEGSRGLQAPEEPGGALSSRASWSGFGLSERRLEVRDGPPTEGAQRLLHLVGEFGSTMVGVRR